MTDYFILEADKDQSLFPKLPTPGWCLGAGITKHVNRDKLSFSNTLQYFHQNTDSLGQSKLREKQYHSFLLEIAGFLSQGYSCQIATVLAGALSSHASFLNCCWAMWPHTAKFCHQHEQDNPQHLGLCRWIKLSVCWSSGDERRGTRGIKWSFLVIASEQERRPFWTIWTAEDVQFSLTTSWYLTVPKG